MINNIAIGVQSFGVSAELTADIEKTLREVKAIGFDLFEPIIVTEDVQGDRPKGFMAKDTLKEVTEAVKKAGLRMVSCHIAAGLNEDPAVVASYILSAHEVSGISRFVFGIPPKTKEDALACAAFVNKVHALVKDKVKLLYHNHGIEFLTLPQDEQTENEKYLMDVIMNRLDPSITIELDFGWAWFARVPYSDLYRYFDRIEIVHLKDFYEACADERMLTTEDSFAPIGEGKAYVKEIIDTLHLMPQFSGDIILDQDFYPAGIMAAEEIGYKTVTSMLPTVPVEAMRG